MYCMCIPYSNTACMYVCMYELSTNEIRYVSMYVCVKHLKYMRVTSYKESACTQYEWIELVHFTIGHHFTSLHFKSFHFKSFHFEREGWCGAWNLFLFAASPWAVDSSRPTSTESLSALLFFLSSMYVCMYVLRIYELCMYVCMKVSLYHVCMYCIYICINECMVPLRCITNG